MADRYWVGGSGTWDATTTTNWSATSGGGGGASVPTAIDAVIVNSASGSPVITVSGTARPCLSLTTTGATCTIAGSIGITVSGNITLSATTTWSNTDTLTIAAISTITTNGVTINSSISSAFSVTLGSALTLATTRTFTFTGGTLTLSTFTLSTGLFSSTTGTRTFAFGTGNITTRGSGTAFNMGGTSLTVTGTPTVNISNNSATATAIGATIFTEANALNFNVTTGTYTITVQTSSIFRSLNFTGFTGTWTPGSSSYTFYGNLTLVAGMTYTASTGTWTFANTSGTATITSAAKTLGSITQSGAGGTVALGSSLNLGGTLTITAGTFNTANFAVTADTLSSSGSGVRTISLGSSTITLIDIFTPVNFTISTNLTFNAGTSQINLTGVDPLFAGGGQTFYNVSFTGASATPGSMTGANTFNNLTIALGTVNGSTPFEFGANQIINGTLNCAGTLLTQRVFVRSTVVGTTRTLTVAVLSANNCDFKDITIAGAAIDTAPASAGDAGGNSGIVFPTAKTVYWNKDTAAYLWNNNAWASSPGGTVDPSNFPLAQDTVIFTAASPPAASTVVWEAVWLVGTLDLSLRTAGATMTLLMNTSMISCGDFTAGAGCTFSATGGSILYFNKYSGFQYITSAGRSHSAAIQINGSTTAAVSLLDAFSTSNTFVMNRGSLFTNNYALSCSTFDSNAGTNTIDLGASTVTLTGSGFPIWSTVATTKRFSNSRINISNFSGLEKTVSMLFPDVYGTVNASPGAGLVGLESDATFNTISSTRTTAFTLRIGANLVVTNWLVSGSPGAVVTYTSSTVNAQRTITYNGPRITLNYISVNSINFSYGIGSPTVQYRVYATNSTNSGNNRGIAFIDGNDRSAILLDTNVASQTWTVPANWNNRNNTIYMVGAGGEGRSAASGGGGGGGGGFTLINNFVATSGENIAYRVGQGFASAGTETGDTGLRSLTVTFVGVTTVAETVAVNYHVFAVPAGTQTGDLMIWFISCTTNVSTVSGSGWRFAGSSGGLACYFRTASSEPANYTIFSSVAGIASGYLATYRNAKYDRNTSSFPTVATPVTVSIGGAVRQNNTVVLAFFSAAFGSTTFSTPGSWSPVASESNANSPSTALFSLSGVTATGPTVTATSTPSGGVGGTGFMFAMSPKFQYEGGGGEPAVLVPTVPAAGGIGQTFNGGAGGAAPLGGGGGAGGPNGVGAAGGAGTVASPSGAGAGGGGSGGGTAGSNSTTTFGAGGNNSSGTGGGTFAGADGQFGGGGAGSDNSTGTAGDGGAGRDWENTVGSGGGGGAISSTVGRTVIGGNYGGGGGGTDLRDFHNGLAAGGAMLIVWQLPRVFVSGVTISPGITIG